MKQDKWLEEEWKAGMERGLKARQEEQARYGRPLDNPSGFIFPTGYVDEAELRRFEDAVRFNGGDVNYRAGTDDNEPYVKRRFFIPIGYEQPSEMSRLESFLYSIYGMPGLRRFRRYQPDIGVIDIEVYPRSFLGLRTRTAAVVVDSESRAYWEATYKAAVEWVMKDIVKSPLKPLVEITPSIRWN